MATIGKKEAQAKAEHYCAYQERSQYEVRGKLIEWGCYGDDLEEVIVVLIDGNFLNEERFAKAYAGGKFRMKQWGRLKIKQGLQLKKISSYCIKKGLETISDEDYEQTLLHLLEKKKGEISEKNPLKLQYKLAAYLQSRGFEPELVWALINAEKKKG